jgi:hypothetical protein
MVHWLSDDEISCICAYLPLPDLYSFSLTQRKHAKLLLNGNAYIWKSVDWFSHYTNLLPDKREDAILIGKYLKKLKSYKHIIQEFVKFKFNSSKVFGTDASQYEELLFLNGGRTVEKIVHNGGNDGHWTTIMTNMSLLSGHIYAWDIVLDEYPAFIRNAYRLFIGLCKVNPPLMDYNLLGHSHGYALNVGQMTFHRGNPIGTVFKKEKYWRGKTIALKSGDVFTCKLDIKGNKYRYVADWNALLSIYLNDRLLASFVVDISKGPYCPAVAIIGNQRITVRPSAMVV